MQKMDKHQTDSQIQSEPKEQDGDGSEQSTLRTLDAASLPQFLRTISHHFHRIEDELSALQETARSEPLIREVANRTEILKTNVTEMRQRGNVPEIQEALRKLEADSEALAVAARVAPQEDGRQRLAEAQKSLQALRDVVARVPELANLLEISGAYQPAEPLVIPELVSPPEIEARMVHREESDAPWRAPILESGRALYRPRVEDGELHLMRDERVGKVRIKLHDDGDQPIEGAPFRIVANLEEEEGEKVILARGVTNSNGYASLNLTNVRREGLRSRSLAVELDIEDTDGSVADEMEGALIRYPIGDKHYRTHRDLGIPHKLKITPEARARIAYALTGTSIEDPDAQDAAHSPETFSFDTEMVDGNCTIKPNPQISVREYFFRQLVLFNEPSVAAESEPVKRQEVTGPIPFGEEDPSTYAVTPATITVGKSILYKQAWRPINQGLGRLLYSLALAPCEEVNLAVIDWSRSERDTRRESTRFDERLEHTMRRDRTIDEIVSATLSGTQSGSSEAGQSAAAGSDPDDWITYAAAAGGFLAGGPGGAAIAALGVSLFSPSNASSSSAAAEQLSEGFRELIADTTQEVTDNVSQRAAAMRSLRSTVVTTSYQKESERIRTRVVRNHNKNHAMTVQYYQVLAHYSVVTEVHQEQDVLFIPYQIIDPQQDVFDTLPSFNKFKLSPSRPITRFLLRHQRVLQRMVPRRFRQTFDLLSRLITCGDVYQIEEPVVTSSRWEITLDSAWRPGVRLYIKAAGREVELHPRSRKNATVFYSEPINLEEIESLKVTFDPSTAVEEAFDEYVKTLEDQPFVPDAVVETLTENYIETKLTYRLDGCTVRARTDPSRFVRRPRTVYITTQEPDAKLSGDDAFVELSLTRPNLDHLLGDWEDRQHQDYCRLQELIAHIQANPMRFMRAIWLAENPDRRALRFSRLKFNGQPLMEQIKNQPVGVYGNYVVFPLLEKGRYVPATQPLEVVSKKLVSTPTPGVFAEVFLSSCNATEKRDITRVIDAKTGCQVSAPEITGITPGSRRDQASLAPTSFPAPVVNVQNAPGAPAPTGLSDALGVLGTPNIFRDMSMGAQTVEAARSLAQQALVSSGERQRAALETLVSLTEAAAAAATGGASGAAAAAAGAAGDGSDGESGTSVGGGTKAAQENVSKGINAAIGESMRNSDPVTTSDQLQNIERARKSGALDEAGFRSATSNLLGDTTAGQVFAGPGAAPMKADLRRWTDLINFVPPRSIQHAIRNRFGSGPDDWSHRGWPFHPLPLAKGEMSVDLYGFVIEKMPSGPDGRKMSASELLHHIRTNINDFIDTNLSQFEPFDEQKDGPIWKRRDPLGAVVHIEVDIPIVGNFGINADDLTIVVSDTQFDHPTSDNAWWQVSTSYGPGNFDHPLAGNRRWEIFPVDQEGAYAFRTMAADRPWGRIDDLLANAVLGGAADLWRSMLERVATFIEDNQGQVAKARALTGEPVPDFKVETHHGIPWKKEENTYFYKSRGRWVEYQPSNEWLPSSS